jgi:heme/copper-type cytochrome/quinol oxidase subunit 2
MTQSMIGFVVVLVALLFAGFMMAHRYRHGHPPEGMARWLDGHHINWLTRRPEVDPKNDNLP